MTSAAGSQPAALTAQLREWKPHQKSGNISFWFQNP
jgi:hypothetical protein